MIRPLVDVRDAARFGGKAAALGVAARAGLPVPPGVAISWDHEPDGSDPLPVADGPGVRYAVRSSAIGEDSGAASFAGAHVTVLGASGAAALLDAIRRVRASGLAAGALAYRTRLGLDGCPPRMGVVVQELVDADVAGVLFTRNPVSGAAEWVIEASWGLGEAVVAGLVVPDRYRLDRQGRLLERHVGEKDLAIRHDGAAGTREVPVAAELVGAPCLGVVELEMLAGLVAGCDRAFGCAEHDIEFAFTGGAVSLLQRRPITGG